MIFNILKLAKRLPSSALELSLTFFAPDYSAHHLALLTASLGSSTSISISIFCFDVSFCFNPKIKTKTTQNQQTNIKIIIYVSV